MKSLEVYISGFMILFGAVIFRLAYSMEYYGEYGPGPGLLPLWTSGLIVVLALINLTIALKKGGKSLAEVLPKGTSLKNVLSCVGAYALFLVLVPHAGFSVSSVLMLFILFSFTAMVLSVLGCTRNVSHQRGQLRSSRNRCFIRAG